MAATFHATASFRRATGFSALVAAAPTAFAANLGEVAETAHGSLPSSMKLGTAGIFVVGFMLVGICLFALWQAGRNPGTRGGGGYFASILGLVIGVLMVYESVVVGVGGETFFGSAGNDVTILGTTQVEGSGTYAPDP